MTKTKTNTKKVSSLQLEKIKVAYSEVEKAQSMFASYLKGIGDMLELDSAKNYNFDIKTGTFNEVE